ncbi:hypothetical protein [Ectobacillus funiculus]|uniref:hypothetical protein n=1 Tax=Ectobacillus funiculus TaxID=137993 RepID=UPI00101CA673|nr:hypothetical protein [Ectobacillus funiculus]
MSFNGNYGNSFWGCDGHDKKENHHNVHHNVTNVAAVNDLTPFLRQLSPGTRVTVQYDSQPPATGVFQGFQNGFVLLDNFNGFPGLTRLLPNRINAISPSGGGRC